MLLLIDNYDSFTYNLVQYFAVLDEDVMVVRNDDRSAAEVVALRPERVCISPGPGGPDEAGVTLEVVRRLAGRVPILGVCLGHQAVAHAFGARIVRAPSVMHGKVSAIRHDGTGLHRGLPDGFSATRYHSLTVDQATLPARFRETAWAADDGCLMGIEDASSGLFGVQYHPEAILTEHGLAVLRNFLAMTG